MQPKMCTKCKKNIAVVFITKMENGNTLNEGYCLKCARSLGIPQIDAAVKQMGISEEDLDALSDEMGSMFAQTDMDDEEDPESRTATFPLFNQQPLAGILFRQVVIVADAAVLCPNGRQNAGFLHFLDECLPFFRQTGEFYIDGIHACAPFSV